MKVTRLLAACALLMLAACSKNAADKPAATAAPAAKPPVVTVNGTAISQDLFDEYAKAVSGGKAPSELAPEDLEKIKENLIRIELIAQQAEKDGLLKEADVANRLELSRLNQLQQITVQKHFKDQEPTEAELRAEYDAQISTLPLVEYHARHIQVSGEDVAQRVIASLARGEDFGELAKKMSADKGSAAKGGDLGWFGASPESKPITDALALLKNGEYTKTPVQTNFGWHVVQLLGTRDSQPPAFEASKDRIGQIVMQKKIKAYSDDMVKAAKIEPRPPGLPAADAAPAAADAGKKN